MCKELSTVERLRQLIQGKTFTITQLTNTATSRCLSIKLNGKDSLIKVGGIDWYIYGELLYDFSSIKLMDSVKTLESMTTPNDNLLLRVRALCENHGFNLNLDLGFYSCTLVYYDPDNYVVVANEKKKVVVL